MRNDERQRARAVSRRRERHHGGRPTTGFRAQGVERLQGHPCANGERICSLAAGARCGGGDQVWEAVNHLDEIPEEFEDEVQGARREGFLGEQQRSRRATTFSDLARQEGARSIVKSKAMTSEEIHLNDALEKAGYEVVETDLGEFIEQLTARAAVSLRLSRRCT